MKRSLTAVAALALLVGCAPTGVDLGPVTDPQPVVQGSDPNAFAIGVGSAVAVAPTEWRGEIEGSTTFVVDDLRADDPTILRVEHASRQYQSNGPGSDDQNALVLVGLAPGHTVLHFLRQGDDVGTMAVEVVAQDPS